MILDKLFSNKLFLILIWSLILISVNTNIDHLVSIETFLNQSEIKDIFNSIRVYLSIFIFFFLLAVTLKSKTINNSFYLPVTIFIFYQFVQIFSLHLSENNNSNINKIIGDQYSGQKILGFL